MLTWAWALHALCKWWWWWWWWWIAFAVCLYDRKYQAIKLFPARTTARGSYHCKSPTRCKQDLNLCRISLQSLMKLCSRVNHYTTALLVLFEHCSKLFDSSLLFSILLNKGNKKIISEMIRFVLTHKEQCWNKFRCSGR